MLGSRDVGLLAKVWANIVTVARGFRVPVRPGEYGDMAEPSQH